MARTQVEEIKERLDILDIVGSYVELHKAGRHYKGKSPFTSEKTPSFFVSPDRGMYYCFSSQKGGDMFTFIQEMEGIDFKGALKILADKAGIELMPEDPKKRDARDTQYALIEEATQFFFKTREGSKDVDAYIEKRGVKGETVHIWRIGYAPDEWRALRVHLTDKKFTDAEMFKAGLIKRADGGKEPYDVFRGRVIFPISDASGRVVAFSGRTLKSKEGIPKYVNSPETELFQKSEILYGYDKAKQGIRHYDFSLIVEGQFDVVLSHQAGYTNAVAVSGTALTTHHIMLLQRLSNRAVLALDADRAGISAIKRSSEPMLERGMDVKVAHMSDGKDPADIIRTNPKDFKRVIGQAEHVIEFLLALIKGEARDERTFKLRVREEILPLILAIPSQIDREHFEKVAAESVGTSLDAIRQEIERIAENRKHEPIPEEKQSDARKDTRMVRRKDDIARHLLAAIEVLRDNHEELALLLESRLAEILTKEESGSLSNHADNTFNEVLFKTEKYLAELNEKQLREELSDRVTELSHIVARERLSHLREEMVKAEHDEREDDLTTHLKATKELEVVLQKTITL